MQRQAEFEVGSTSGNTGAKIKDGQQPNDEQNPHR
jgi:hypothetical protein